MTTAPVPKLCGRCGAEPVIPGRSGPPRCANCAGAATSGKQRLRRNPRRSRPRAVTISGAALRREVAASRSPGDETLLRDQPRPRSRGECRDDERPCPWVACRHHLYLEANPETGAIKVNFPDLEPWELIDTCALDVAERGALTLEEIAARLNLTRERTRQLEVHGLFRIKMASPSPEEVGADLLQKRTGADPDPREAYP
jgi:hypothetical protein